VTEKGSQKRSGQTPEIVTIKKTGKRLEETQKKERIAGLLRKAGKEKGVFRSSQSSTGEGKSPC